MENIIENFSEENLEEKEEKKLSRSKNFIFTLNNPNNKPEGYLRAIYNKFKPKCVAGQLEKGENGTPHI